MSLGIVSRTSTALALIATLGFARAVSADGPVAVESVEWAEQSDAAPEHLHVLRFLAPASDRPVDCELAHAPSAARFTSDVWRTP